VDVGGRQGSRLQGSSYLPPGFVDADEQGGLHQLPHRDGDGGFLAYREVTAKGGGKQLYRPSPEAPDERAFRRVLADRIIDKARTELAGDVPESDI
jgi:hypothetical protein